MNRTTRVSLRVPLVALTFFCLLLLMAVPTVRADFTPSGTVLFTRSGWDHNPSVMVDGNLEKFWWCGSEGSPPNPHDVIYYRHRDVSTGVWSPIVKVLEPTPFTWDSLHTCDPSVVKGIFVNPTNGQTYSYVMYYSATDAGAGNTRIGLAFSNNGISWIKHAGNPVISPECADAQCQQDPYSVYGAGQAVAYSFNQQAGLHVFYTDTTTSLVGDRIFVRSTWDGINFETRHTISNLGFPKPNNMADSEFGFDPNTGFFYATFGTNFRGTGDVILGGCPHPTWPNSFDRDGYQRGIFRMHANDLLFGAQGTWETLGFYDTSLHRWYLTVGGGMRRDPHGNISPWLPNLILYFAKGDNCWDTFTWDLATVTWRETPTTMPFNDFWKSSSPSDHINTTGLVPSGYSFAWSLGHLFMAPGPNRQALYQCKVVSNNNYMVSPAENCEGQLKLGTIGFMYISPPPGISVVPLYRCRAIYDHFVSTAPSCNGWTTEFFLGYSKASPG